MSAVGDNVKRIFAEIRETAAACGRDPESVRLVAVSKTVAPERVREAIESGVTDLGENYVQEALEKIEVLGRNAATWHFIGHLQSNKARFVVQAFDLIHTVDSMKLARELDKRARAVDKIQKVLVQVNISAEETKSGVAFAEAADLVRQIACLGNLSVQGLMTMPPFFNAPDKVRPFFRALKQLADRIGRDNIPRLVMKELSMGMTGDFKTAIEEGATMVRIGTAIFGERTRITAGQDGGE